MKETQKLGLTVKENALQVPDVSTLKRECDITAFIAICENNGRALDLAKMRAYYQIYLVSAWRDTYFKTIRDYAEYALKMPKATFYTYIESGALVEPTGKKSRLFNKVVERYGNGVDFSASQLLTLFACVKKLCKFEKDTTIDNIADKVVDLFYSDFDQKGDDEKTACLNRVKTVKPSMSVDNIKAILTPKKEKTESEKRYTLAAIEKALESIGTNVNTCELEKALENAKGE